MQGYQMRLAALVFSAALLVPLVSPRGCADEAPTGGDSTVLQPQPGGGNTGRRPKNGSAERPQVTPDEAASARQRGASSPRQLASVSKPSPAVMRLPRYFAGLVDERQRAEIHRIQAEYQDQIDRLEKELAALVQAQRTAVEAVLTDSQRKLLQKRRNPPPARPAGDEEMTQAVP